MSFEQYQRQRQQYLESLEEPVFDATVLYYNPSESRWASVARHPLFFLLTMTIVLLNALWLGYDANENTAPTIWEAETHFLVVEQLFCVFFTMELLIRFAAFRRKRDFRKDQWFVFDLVLVLMMVSETWVLQPLSHAIGFRPEDSLGDFSVLRMMRLLKLTRLTRFVRLLHFCPEMLTMLRGIGRAMVSVFITTCLLVALLYIFGIIFKTQAEAFPSLHDTFATVGDAMWWLLLHGTFLDAIADVVPELRAVSPVMTSLFMVFTFFSHLTLLNMLVGILCEVVTQVSKTEKEQAAVSAFKTHLLPILEIHAVSNEGRLRKQEFELLMRNPEMHVILGNLGVDAEDFIALKDILYEDKSWAARPSPEDSSDEEGDPASKQLPVEEPDLSFAEFMESALRLRGGNQARVQDIVELREYLKNRVDELVPDLLSQLQRSLRAEASVLASRPSSRTRSSRGEDVPGAWSSPLRAASADITSEDQGQPRIIHLQPLRGSEVRGPSPTSMSGADGEDALWKELTELRAEVKVWRKQAAAREQVTVVPGGSAAQQWQPGSAELADGLAQLRDEVREMRDRIETLRRRPRSPQAPRRHWDEMGSGNLAETV